MLGCGDAKWCGMTYGLRSGDAQVISAICNKREGSGTRREGEIFGLGCDWLSRA